MLETLSALIEMPVLAFVVVPIVHGMVAIGNRFVLDLISGEVQKSDDQRNLNANRDTADLLVFLLHQNFNFVLGQPLDHST